MPGEEPRLTANGARVWREVNENPDGPVQHLQQLLSGPNVDPTVAQVIRDIVINPSLAFNNLDAAATEAELVRAFDCAIEYMSYMNGSPDNAANLYLYVFFAHCLSQINGAMRVREEEQHREMLAQEEIQRQQEAVLQQREQQQREQQERDEYDEWIRSAGRGV